MLPKCNKPGRTQWTFAATWGLCAALVLVMFAGCATQTQSTTKLGQWNQPEAPLVLAGDRPDKAARAYDAAREDLSEAQWNILERYAPRSAWERIRANRADIEAAQNAVIASRPAEQTPTDQPAALPDVPTQIQSDGQVQMYYRIRHYGGVDVKSSQGKGLSRRTVTVVAGDTTSLVALVAKHLADNGTVTMLPGEQVLVITCKPEVKQSVLQLLARVDVPTAQVEISARIFEVQHDMDFQMGAKLLLKYLGSTDQAGVAGVFSAEDFAGSVIDPIAGTMADPSAAMRLLNVFGDSGWSLDTTIQALAKTGLIKLVSSPRMTVTVGNTGYILAGQELPIQSAIEANNNVIIQEITYKPVGVQLYVTPQVIGTDSVKLHVVTVASEVTGFQSLTAIGGASSPMTNPIFDTREAESYVTVPDRSALVIGGLRRVRTITRENKIPGLGDIPYLGWMFKNHRSQTQITDLYFFITPRIIRP